MRQGGKNAPHIMLTSTTTIKHSHVKETTRDRLPLHPSHLRQIFHQLLRLSQPETRDCPDFLDHLGHQNEVNDNKYSSTDFVKLRDSLTRCFLHIPNQNLIHVLHPPLIDTFRKPLPRYFTLSSAILLIKNTVHFFNILTEH